MINFSYTIWILLIPFLMFILLGLGGSKLKARLSGSLGTRRTGTGYSDCHTSQPTSTFFATEMAGEAIIR